MMRLSKSIYVQDLVEVFHFKERFWIICEEVTGNFTDLLIALNTDYSENFIKYACYKVLQSMQFLHARHIIHRDIKSDT